jgi:hypothetical protein
MAMSSGEVERKVRQLDNDVQAIHGLLHDLSATQARQGNRLDEIQANLDGHGQRHDGIDGRLDGIETSLAEILRRLPG